MTTRTLAFEGLIGVGKTTLCAKRDRDTTDLIKELVNERFLALFYADPIKYGFAFQLFMMAHRLYNKNLVERHLIRAKHVFWDRSTLGDFIFALVNEADGNIHPPEMEAYVSMLKDKSMFYRGSERGEDGSVLPFSSSLTSSSSPSDSSRSDGGEGEDAEEGMTAGWSVSDVLCNGSVDDIVFLFDQPERCKRRVEEERKISSEDGIPLAYYVSLHIMHFKLLMRLWQEGSTLPVVALWEQYADIKDGDVVKSLDALKRQQLVPRFADSLEDRHEEERPRCVLPTLQQEPPTVGSETEIWIPVRECSREGQAAFHEKHGLSGSTAWIHTLYGLYAMSREEVRLYIDFVLHYVSRGHQVVFYYQ